MGVQKVWGLWRCLLEKTHLRRRRRRKGEYLKHPSMGPCSIIEYVKTPRGQKRRRRRRKAYM